tara:strand:- start:390 stop:560 length:171 start_codon:yes stop_codon:yes gene_type:complete
MTYDNLAQPFFFISLTLFIGFMIGLVVMFMVMKEELKQLENDKKIKRHNKFLSDDV